MPINTFPIATVPPAANLILNVPSGSVTATDVQAAINQLASLIPSVGSGTDPLFLVQGLSVVKHNPTVSGNTTDRWLTKIRHTTDCAEVDPLFANNEALNIQITATHGQATNGGLTTAKQSFYGYTVDATINASGQKFAMGESVTGYGMSDTAIGQQFVRYAGGPVNGDEGQAFRLVSTLNQQNFLMQTTISAKPTQSTVNTTTTQVINKSKNAQTITIANGAGAVVGDWVVIEQQAPNSQPNLEAIQIQAPINTGIPGSITGVFDYNHLSGVTVTPALRISCPSTFQMGQDRVLVNLSGATYSVGTASGQGGLNDTFIGAGTAWTNSMVGGNAANIGAIALAADDYSDGPFSIAAPCKSWWQIKQVASNTDLKIYSFTIAGETRYHGKSAAQGPYIIRPAARILRIMASAGSVTGELILETSTHTWNVNDVVECAICPYPDVTGFQYGMSAYTNGGTYRGFMYIGNGGARTIQAGIRFIDSIYMYQPTADGLSFGVELDLTGASCGSNISCRQAQTAAIDLGGEFTGGGTDAAGKITWGGQSTNLFIAPNTANGGLELRTLINASPTNQKGIVRFLSSGNSRNPDTAVGTGARSAMEVDSFLFLPVVGTGGEAQRPSYILIDVNNSFTANYERMFYGREFNDGGGWPFNFSVETGFEAAGTGTVRDHRIMHGGVEQMRFKSGQPIRFGSNGFSANAAVATALTSLGPTGSHTTVQEWLTVTNPSGVTRYIPCF